MRQQTGCGGFQSKSRFAGFVVEHVDIEQLERAIAAGGILFGAVGDVDWLLIKLLQQVIFIGDNCPAQIRKKPAWKILWLPRTWISGGLGH
jgi:hypothetical protein